MQELRARLTTLAGADAEAIQNEVFEVGKAIGLGRSQPHCNYSYRSASMGFSREARMAAWRRSLDAALGGKVKTSLTRAARSWGRALGATSRLHRPATRGSVRALRELLDGLGAEPYVDGALLRLRNCPFDTVASTYPELVCGTNLNLVEGVMTGLGTDGLEAVLEPAPGRCCVAIARKGGRNA